MAAAHEAGAPVILQASAGARKYAGEAFIKHLILAAIDEMLQSVTYVWARPPGPAPAPIFQERIALLSRFHSLPPPQTPGRLQADTALGRLIVQDMSERNLLLEAYAARK